MISDSQFAKARSSLFLDSCLTYLHETKSDYTSSILSGGLMLDKSYNGEISRVVKQARTEDEIKEYLAGNLCRCTGYAGQLRAIKKYLDWKKSGEA